MGLRNRERNHVSTETTPMTEDVQAQEAQTSEEAAQDVTSVQGETAQDTQAQEATAAAETKRAARKPIDVGQIVVTPSTRTITARPSKAETSPLFLAVKNAPVDQWQDVHTPNPDGVKTLLRRFAAHPAINKGMSIAPGEVDSDQTEGYKVVSFQTHAERKTRKAADTPAEGTEATPDAEVAETASE